MTLHVFGIRHHGPGCARNLRAALQALAPDAVLIEGPPDAQAALSLVADAGMKPPIALLVHEQDAPQNAVFYPFAEFSPEWQALRYASEAGLQARFMDLPCAIQMAADAAPESDTEPDGEPDGEPDVEVAALRADPIGMLAEAAGFTDREQWWDVQVEQRRDATGLFAGILEAMGTLREQHAETDLREQRREAYMRTVIREAQKEGFQKIAIVCGAWHAPRLATLGPAKADAELLKGLPKIKVASTWIPWTYSRLAFRSGYGAGVESPGWYAHLWHHPDRASTVWATLAARLLREQDIDASAANVIETVRLADTLAAVRELPAPGLRELREAIEAVLCGGEASRLALIRSGLEIGEALGAVPEGAGQVPLARDFEREVKRLRMKITTEQLPLVLDLRKDNDLDRSRLLHRLRVLGVEWGRVVGAGKTSGTFRESWQTAWRPELAIDLIAGNLHGNTVEVAAANSLTARAQSADLAALTPLIEVAILAHLPSALDRLLVELSERAALSSDVRLQMEAVAPLARIARYSDVRDTRAEHVLPVLHALFERIFIGVAPACTQLDDDAAAKMSEALGTAHAACLLLDQAELTQAWLDALRRLMESDAAHPRIRGRSCRLLLEQRALGEGELARRASLALSPSLEAAHAAQWIEGVLAGDGLLLVHQDELLGTLDAWLSGLSVDTFEAQLPLLRRAFCALNASERQAVARRMKTTRPGTAAARAVAQADELDAARVGRVLPVLAQILGVEHG